MAMPTILYYAGAFYLCKLSVQFLLWAWAFFKGHVLAQVLARFTDRKLPQTYGRWAVVTGSTDGIGKAYARELAKAGHDIILISRTLEKLQMVAAEIRGDFGVEVEIIQADFSYGRVIYEGISKELRGKDIGVLVNNVGFAPHKPMVFEDLSEEALWKLVNVNVGAILSMTQTILPNMLARRRGAIINISSTGALMPCPLLQVYSATRTFVDYFSRALQYEYRSSGVTIQTVLPGAVITKMLKYNENLQKPSLLVVPAPKFAAWTLASLGFTDRIVGYWSHTLKTTMMMLCPNWLIMAYVESFLSRQMEKKTD